MTGKKDQFTEIHVQMDNLVEEHKTLTEELESFMSMAKAKKEQIDATVEIKKEKTINMQKHIEAQLRVLAEQVPQKDSKTQSKVQLLSGNVIIKKPTQTLVADKDKLIEWATEQSRLEYIDEKTVRSFKWKELKGDLDIVDGKVINLVTGELFEIDGITIEEKGEEVVIK